ncbi:hypothetical protein CsSME_00000908 [Camellia sinensis var. sinensis]
MAMIPSIFGGRRSKIFNPFSLAIWDPFEGFPFSTTLANIPNSARETSAFANTDIDGKETPEAHIFKADLPGNGKFLRRFRLPKNAKVDQFMAMMENGVLTVTVPKEEVKKPEVKSVQIYG